MRCPQCDLAMSIGTDERDQDYWYCPYCGYGPEDDEDLMIDHDHDNEPEED